MTKLFAISFGVGLFIPLIFTAESARADETSSADDAGAATAPVESETPTDKGDEATEPKDDAFEIEQPSDPVTTETPKTFEKLPGTEAEPAPTADPEHRSTTPSVESQSQPQTSVPQAHVTVQTFHTELSPHGTWYDSPEHGWVWCPRVGYGWRPYSSHGRWIYTSHGWTWRSYHRWGWAPFHYGRWFVHPSLGWSWVPGTSWAPAWVSWRYNAGHIGWAPVPPGYTSYTSATAQPLIHDSHWTFVPGDTIISPRVYRYAIDHSYPSYAAIYRTTVYSPVYSRVGRVVHAGPRPAVLARAIGRVVKPIPIVYARQPGARATVNAIPVYRPMVRAVAGKSRPVVGVRGPEFSGGRPGAVIRPVSSVHRPHGIAVAPTVAKWQPSAVAPLNILRSIHIPARTNVIRRGSIRPGIVRPGVVRPTVVRPSYTQPGAIRPPVKSVRPVRDTTSRIHLTRRTVPKPVATVAPRPTVKPTVTYPATTLTTTKRGSSKGAIIQK